MKGKQYLIPWKDTRGDSDGKSGEARDGCWRQLLVWGFKGSAKFLSSKKNEKGIESI